MKIFFVFASVIDPFLTSVRLPVRLMTLVGVTLVTLRLKESSNIWLSCIKDF